MMPLALFLIAIAAVYLGVLESAFSALMRLSLRLVAERSARGVDLGRYLDDPLLFFVPVRVLSSFTLVVAGVVIARMTGFGTPRAMGIVLASMAAFVLVCQHLLPLLIVRQSPERVLEVLLPSFVAVSRVVHPLTVGLVGLAAAARRDRQPAAPAGSESADETADHGFAYLEAGEQEGLIEREERKLLQSIMELGDKLVREVMTPRPDIVAIRGDATLAELRALLRDQEYSRVPVFKDRLDNILGVVFVKDLIHADVGGGSDERPVTSIMRPAYFVPETKPVYDLLKEFQRQQVQIAIVVDEYGGTAGLVTLEDLLEEIVGEIRDEYDQEVEPVTDEGNGAFVFGGKVNIDEVAERLGVRIEPEGFETVGGYLLAHLGRVPATGERFDIDGLSVEVLEAERRRVNRVRIRKHQPVSQP
ncbi:MAG: hemolysin family protein [Vicinamibacterales bacterium]